MSKKMTLKAAVSHIEKAGVLLVFPINNRKEPPSLWSSFFPRSEMKWEWDDEGDTRVADLWHLRMELSESSKVVYGKWFRGRATFFSKRIFTALMSVYETANIDSSQLSDHARTILEILEMDSPLSTKQLKKAADLQGRLYEGVYNKALKELWSKLLIVGFGEVDDGAFPSLAIGAVKNIFEDLYLESKALDKEEARKILASSLSSIFLSYI